MGVRHRHDINMANAPVPEIWRDHLLSDVHARGRTSFKDRKAAAIYKHRAPIRERDQQAVALTNINCRYLQPAWGCRPPVIDKHPDDQRNTLHGGNPRNSPALAQAYKDGYEIPHEGNWNPQQGGGP